MSTHTRLQSDMVGSSLHKQSCSKKGIVYMHKSRLNEVMARVRSVACDELKDYFYEKLLCGYKIYA